MPTDLILANNWFPCDGVNEVIIATTNRVGFVFCDEPSAVWFVGDEIVIQVGEHSPAVLPRWSP